MGGSVAQQSRRHYLANVFVTDGRRDGKCDRDFGLVFGSSLVPNVTVQWLFESLLSDKLLPLTDFTFPRPAH